MIHIVKVPLRLSFFGGGTDYREYFANNKGSVLGTTINVFVYIASLPMVGFAEQRFRIMYRQIENANSIDEIQHPVIRETLRDERYNEPLNISIMADLPGGTGLGSSSSFTVGFIQLIKCLKNEDVSRYALAKHAIRMEHDILKENVGVQDQIHATYGGLSKYSFYKDDFSITPVRINSDCKHALDQSIFLIYTGSTRSASTVLNEQIKRTQEGQITQQLNRMTELVDQGVAVLEQVSPDKMLKELGEMLNEAWLTKKSLSGMISNGRIDEIYQTAMDLGAYGGKLCGAGGGGFMAMIAPAHLEGRFRETFGKDNICKVKIEENGSRIIQSV